jgi:hypothetical protein
MILRPLLFIACGALAASYLSIAYLALHPKVSFLYRAYYIDRDLKYWNHGKGLHYTLGQTLHFDQPLPYLSREGWSSSETDGTWSEGPSGKLFLELGERTQPTEVRLTLIPFLAPERHLDGQRIAAWANGVKLGEAILNSPGTKEISFRIPPSVTLREGGVLEIRFEYPDAAAPSTIGSSTEARRLAFYFRRFVVR